jgi:hypothetical protein
MKKIALLIATLFTVTALSACGDICVGPECITGETGGEVVAKDEKAIQFTHIDGHGNVVEMTAYILFEVELRDYVKYQVAYLSCTCRDKVVNYWNVMYLEVDKATGAVQYISFDQDGEGGHYTPGTWGDSSGDPNQNGVTYEQLKADFFPWIVGKTEADFAGIDVFDNDGHLGVTNDVTIAETDLIDAFAGSSVSTNNMIQIVKTMLGYHNEKY